MAHFISAPRSYRVGSVGQRVIAKGNGPGIKPLLLVAEGGRNGALGSDCSFTLSPD